MNRLKSLLPLTLLAALCWPSALLAQHPTATQPMQLSGFAGGSFVYTGLSGGKNGDFTAGVDLALPTFYRHYRPSVEVRGAIAVDKGHIVSQREILFGGRLDYMLIGSHFHPYADFLLGRGQMNYGNGYFFEGYDYLLSTTNVFSPGIGVDIDINRSWALKLDGQIQHWGYAPTPSGNVWSKYASVAAVYHFDFNHHHHARERSIPPPPPTAAPVPAPAPAP